MNSEKITNEFKEFVSSSAKKEKFIHSESDNLVLFKPTNEKSFFNSDFYIADNNIFQDVHTASR